MLIKHNNLWHSPWPPWGPSAPFGPGGPGSPWGPCSPGGPLIPGIMKKSLTLSPLLEGRCLSNMRGWQQFSKTQWGQQGNWVTAYLQVSVHKTLTNQCMEWILNQTWVEWGRLEGRQIEEIKQENKLSKGKWYCPPPPATSHWFSYKLVLNTSASLILWLPKLIDM